LLELLENIVNSKLRHQLNLHYFQQELIDLMLFLFHYSAVAVAGDIHQIDIPSESILKYIEHYVFLSIALVPHQWNHTGNNYQLSYSVQYST
jgi:hypothetical protein